MSVQRGAGGLQTPSVVPCHTCVIKMARWCRPIGGRKLQPGRLGGEQASRACSLIVSKCGASTHALATANHLSTRSPTHAACACACRCGRCKQKKCTYYVSFTHSAAGLHQSPAGWAIQTVLALCSPRGCRQHMGPGGQLWLGNGAAVTGASRVFPAPSSQGRCSLPLVSCAACSKCKRDLLTSP